MALAPTLAEHIARARSDLRMGLGVVLESETGRSVAFAIETLSPERLDAARRLGPAVATLTARRAETLKARAYDGDLARIVLPEGVQLDWIRALADPAGDLMSPMKGPLRAARGGIADHHRAALLLCKAARLLPAALVVDMPEGMAAPDLVVLSAAAVLAPDSIPGEMAPVVSARLPLAVSEAGRLHIFRPEDGGDEHYAVEIGAPSRHAPVLTRLHSACFTGDLLGSLKCDCGPQLRGALDQMGIEGAGVLLYLNQEGRGIGLANKMRAYSLQDQGFDTVEANHRLGFEDEERDFRVGAGILRTMGFRQARLMTNNPAKVAMLASNGIEVTERVPLKVGRRPENAAYLDTKASKSGHLL